MFIFIIKKNVYKIAQTNLLTNLKTIVHIIKNLGLDFINFNKIN